MLFPRLIAMALLCCLGAHPTTYDIPFEGINWLPSKLVASDSNLFVFQDDQGRSGFINSTGVVILIPSLEGHVGDFVDGLANVTGVGYINERGEWVIEGDFLTTDDFSDGLAKVEFKADAGSEQNISYIDKTGRVAFRASRFQTGAFSEGMTWYQAEGAPSNEAVISIGGRRIPKPYPGLFGFINRTGVVVVSPQFYSVGSFVDGLAWAAPEGRCYVRTQEGPAPLEMPWGFFTGFGGGSWSMGPGVVCPVGFVDASGTFKIDPQFDAALDFAEGRAGVLVEGLWGFIQRDGSMAVAPKYEQVRSFSEGLAAVKLDGKWGFIDTDGRMVVEPQFVWVDSFSDSLSRAGRVVDGNEEFFYIDRQGQIAMLGPFAAATPFVNGLAAVLYPERDDQDNGQSAYYINKTGGVVFSYPYD